MLKVKAKLDKSPIHGIGLFADEPISKGDLVFILDNLFDKKFTKKVVDEWGYTEFFDTYAVFSKKTNLYTLCIDNARFVNHSDTPNIKFDEKTKACIATRDIAIGEEITEDYSTIDDNHEPFK